MPSVTVTVPTFPFVPNLPGVPALIRAAADVNLPDILAQAAAGNSPAILTGMLNGSVPSMLNGVTNISDSSLLTDLTGGDLLDADSPSVSAQASGPQWGIFDSDNNPVIVPDSVVEFDFSGDYRISKYRVEQGGFADYNKVAVPFEIRMTMTKGGSVEDRTNFLNAIKTVKQSTDLYSAVTPELTYMSVNLIHDDYARKSDNGATLITAFLHLEEVRVTATAAYSQTAQPSGAGQVSDGTVQATAPTSTQTTAAAGGAN